VSHGNRVARSSTGAPAARHGIAHAPLPSLVRGTGTIEIAD
jgi:hypothetical protein